MRHSLLLLALVAAPLVSAQSQTTLYPGQSGAALLSSIRAGYTPTNTLGYGPARDELYAYEQATDGALCGVYTQFCIQLTPGADPSTDAYNKGVNAEHTWPQSRGASAEPARSDLHHLFPAKANVNSSRGAEPYREIPDADADGWYRQAASQSTTPSANLAEWSEKDNASYAGFGGSFEPRDDHKGDAARAAFYFAAIYDTEVAQAGAQAFFDAMKEDLIDWHYADPVSAEEAARSSWIAGWQGRENPFILDSTLARRAFDLGSSGAGGGGTGSGDGTLWVNELHYDNAGTDADEGVEIAGPAGTPLAGWSLVFYNGSNGTVYKTVALSGTVPSQQGGHGTVWVAVSGVQNGAPDGVALVDPTGAVAEFVSYEGTLTATDGPAGGQTATPLGVAETSGTPVGHSVQRSGTGSAGADFAWGGPAAHSRGLPNPGQTFVGTSAPVAWVNELHYDNAGGDVNEGIEIAGTAGLDLAGWSVVLYNGNGGAPYATVALSGTIDDEGAGLGARWFAKSGIQNGGSDGLALVDDTGAVVQFLSYEGTLTASSGAAVGDTSQDIGVAETSGTAVGRSVQLTGAGAVYADFAWAAPQPHSRGSLNAGQTGGSAKTGPPLAADRAPALDAAVYPNPTRGRATVTLALEAPAEVRADVFDALGRRVASVEAGEVQPGFRSLSLDLAAMPPGVYVVRVAAGGAVQTRRLTVVR